MNVHCTDGAAIRARIAVSSCPSQIPIRMPPFDLQRKDFVPLGQLARFEGERASLRATG
jgi:hypothetical protein